MATPPYTNGVHAPAAPAVLAVPLLSQAGQRALRAAATGNTALALDPAVAALLVQMAADTAQLRAALEQLALVLASGDVAAASVHLQSDPRLVALAAQGWAGRDDPAPATFNQRLSILSSFYGYARKQALLIRDNPISFIDRRSAQSYANAEALTPHRIAGTLKALKAEVDLTSQRDYALIRVAVSTGRRVNELPACAGAMYAPRVNVSP